MEDSPLIHADIKKAHTLPSKYYTESSVFGEIISKLSKSFHFAAHISQFEKNNIIPLPQLENILNESLILVKSDKIRRGGPCLWKVPPTSQVFAACACAHVLVHEYYY